MKVQDQVRWEDQKLELQADERSRAFLAFFEEWMTDAEEIYDIRGEEGLRTWTLPAAVRQALSRIEDRKGHLSMEWIGQMLLLAREHWIYGEALASALTRLEKRMLEQMEAVKIAELQALATVTD